MSLISTVQIPIIEHIQIIITFFGNGDIIMRKVLLMKSLVAGAAILLLVSPFTASSFGDTSPVIGLHEKTPNVVALKNVRIVTGTGDIIPGGTIVIRDGRIEAFGAGIEAPPDAVTRNLTGKFIYPGFIDLFSSYGMPEGKKENTGSQEQAAGGVSRRAGHWNRAVRPELSAAELFLPDRKKAEAYRKSGFTTVLSFPKEGLFRGTGVLALLSDTLARQAILAENIGGAFSFNKGSSSVRGGVEGYPSSLQGHIALIRQTLLDALWYEQAWEAYSANPALPAAPEKNLSLAALKPYILSAKPLLLETTRELDLFRAAKLMQEFKLKMWAVGTGSEYRRLDALKKTGLNLIIPVNFPEAPDVENAAYERDISLRELRHWDFAPENPGRLVKAGIRFTLTAAGLEKPEDFLNKLRIAVSRGLPKESALAALTVTPALWLGMSGTLGALGSGKPANFIVADGDIFEKKTKIIETWVDGKAYPINPTPLVNLCGEWELRISCRGEELEGKLKITGKEASPKADLLVGEKKIKVSKTSLEKRLVSLVISGDSLGLPGLARLSGMVAGDSIRGRGTWGDGTALTWQARLVEPQQEKPDTAKPETVGAARFSIVFPEGAFGRTAPAEQPEVVLVKGATIWTCGPRGLLEEADMLVKRGKIAAVGRGLSAPEGALVIEAKGKHLTPGLIDAHSHLAITGGVNESTQAITSEVRISDVINSDDINIYRQLAGGLTSALVLHGSANPIGGQNALIKLRWGQLPDRMLFEEGMPTIKFALGENVTQASIPRPRRYPASRMGVEQLMRDWFGAAKEYRRNREAYNAVKKNKRDKLPPRRDLRLEALMEVLEGKRWVHCHAYRQDETLAMVRVAEEMGFKIAVFIHILEGYKVAEVIREHGAMPTTFSDWWAYKFEVYDAIPYNGALMHEQGLLVSFNSDNIELARRMNLEAAKAVKYGGIQPEEALKFVTVNSAVQLGIDHRVGSLEEGKDADFVLWNSDPLSTYSLCEQTWIDGCKYFDLEEDRTLRSKAGQQRVELVQKILALKNGKK
jgi:imidazolonepropionase-like amidohydrolase